MIQTESYRKKKYEQSMLSNLMWSFMTMSNILTQGLMGAILRDETRNFSTFSDRP